MSATLYQCGLCWSSVPKHRISEHTEQVGGTYQRCSVCKGAKISTLKGREFTTNCRIANVLLDALEKR